MIMTEKDQVQKINPLIEKHRSNIPGMTFRLPSLGYFYDEGVLAEDVVDGEVVIYPMRLREELAMKSLDSIFQGRAVLDTVRYCVPQILKPEKIISEDIDYILTAIKKMTHGEHITYRMRCIPLEDKLQEAVDGFDDTTEELAKSEMDESSRKEDLQIDEQLEQRLEEFNQMLGDDEKDSDDDSEENVERGLCEFEIPLSHFLENSKPLNPELIEEKLTFDFQNFHIKSKPLTFEDLRIISTLKLKEVEDMDQDDYIDFATDFSNLNITKRILSVDGITDEKTIMEWVESLKLEDRSEILDKMIKGLEWGIDFTYVIECEKCNKTTTTDQSYLNPLYFFLMS